jgi:membrane protein
MSVRNLLGLFKQAFQEWQNDKAPRLGAALAYYSVFSLAPLLIIAVAIAGLVFGEKAAQGALDKQLAGQVGAENAAFLEGLIKSAYDPRSGVIATVVGLVTLLFGATGVFVEIQDALDTIWKVTPRPGRAVWTVVRDRFYSFLMVLGIGLLLLASVVLTTLVQALEDYLPALDLPAGLSNWQLLNAVVSFLLLTLLFAMVYKILPDVRIRWGDVWPGAVVAGLLFTLGKYLIGVYLGKSSVTSSYGLAGSLVAVLIWIYYSAQILLFGAEFTRAWTLRRGHPVAPDDKAVPIIPATQAR